jgi:hypothetical protein
VIAMNLPSIPRPAVVDGLIGSQVPARVMEAQDEAVFAALQVTERRAPLSAAELEAARVTVAVNNKILAAYNPGLIVRIGGAL